MRKILSIATVLMLSAFLFSNCGDKEVDPCEDVVCLNGGNCVDGLCKCPEGWTGDRCQTEAAPQFVYITKVKVTKMPFYNGGQPWDPSDNSDPDIKIRVLLGGTSVIYSSPYPKTNHPVYQEYTFTCTPKVVIDQVTKSHTLELVDEDDFNDALMGSVDFIPWKSGDGKPTTMTIGDDNDEVQFVLTLSYL